MIFKKSDPITPAAPKKNKSRLMIILSVVMLCVAAIVIYFVTYKQSVAPFPASITTGLNYQVYYSPNNPSGYSLQAGSAKIQAGILFFTMQNGSKKRIFVTEQAVPSNSINFSSLPKHTSLDVPIGRALIGTGLGNPSVVIMTSSTLIQLTSSKGVSQSDISGVAQKLTFLAPAGNQY